MTLAGRGDGRAAPTGRLSNAMLAGLPAGVRRPSYDRGAARVGIVHLGIGAFHRGHQAVYTDDALAVGDRTWGILGASLRSSETADALRPQDGLYTLAVRDGAKDDLRVIGSVLGTVVAADDPEPLLVALSDPAVRIVSLTVTEKGYCHAPATGALDDDHPDIRHDLAAPGRPRSMPGLVVEALRRRRTAGLAPFTVLSCDNLPANGRTTASVLARYAAMRDPDLGRHVADELACPSTMVDRIVPATTAADRDDVAARLGVRDAWPVMTEPFTQWVIEDRFPTGRPAWAATFTSDVEPFELAKLRLLNGSHSLLAYLGQLAGHETVADAIADPGIAAAVRGLMQEAGETLPATAGLDLEAYKRSLLARFRNPALRHRTAQIAMDGSQKLPQRLLGTARDRLATGRDLRWVALGVAAWMRFVAGTDDAGRPLPLQDPLADGLMRLSRGADPDASATALLELRQVFGDDLPAEPRFTVPVKAALRSLAERGVAATLAEASQAP